MLQTPATCWSLGQGRGARAGTTRAAPGAAPVIPPAPIAPLIAARIDAQSQATTAALGQVRDAVNRIGTQQELTPAQVSTVLLNLEGGPDPMNPGQNIPPAPLTAQLLAQGKINMRQLIVPAEVQSYEKALRERRIAKDSDGREERVYSTREGVADREGG